MNGSNISRVASGFKHSNINHQSYGANIYDAAIDINNHKLHGSVGLPVSNILSRK